MVGSFGQGRVPAGAPSVPGGTIVMGEAIKKVPSARTQRRSQAMRYR
jgi:hypothetical protein